MAAFLDLIRARLAPGDRLRHRGQPADGAARVPAANEPFGPPPALRLHWQLERAGGLASCWQPATGRARPIPPA